MPEPRTVVDDDEEVSAPLPQSTPTEKPLRGGAVARAANQLGAQAANRGYGGGAAIGQGAYPTDASAWTLEDIRRARAANFSRFAEAVIAYARDNVGDASVAQAFIEMLPSAETQNQAAESQEAADPEAIVPRVRPMPTAPPALIAALGILQVDAGRDAMVAVLKQETTTDAPDGTAVSAIVKALLAERAAKADDIIFDVVTRPSDFRPSRANDAVTQTGFGNAFGGGRPVDAERLAEEALRELRNSGSADLRRRLAEYVVAESHPVRRQAIMTALLDDRPENIPAWAKLVSGGALFGHAREDQVLRMLAERADRAISYALGLPIKETTTGANGFGVATSTAYSEALASPREEAALVANALWEPLFSQAQSERLAIRDPREAGRLLRIGYSIPTQTVRDRILKYMEMHWDDPQGAMPGFASAEVMLDPGLVFAFKSLPHERETYRLDWTYEQRRKMFDRRTARTNVRATSQADRLENARNKAAWTEKLEQFVLAWITRGLDASLSGGIENSSNSEATLEIPADGEVAAIWRGAVPGRLEGALGSQTAASPTSVEFLRVIVKARPRSIHGFYLKQLDGAISRPTETGRWLDWIDPAPPAGQSRSIDVLIRADGFRDGPSSDGREEEERLAIDVLVISARRFVD